MKLSIITINFNNCKGLEKTILSVIDQSFKDFEHIIIDGKSTDNSKSIIEKYSSSISKWLSEEDDGIYPAMNKGLKWSSGEYLLFLNSGDYLSKPKILELVFSKNRKEDILYGDVLINKNNNYIPGSYVEFPISLNYMYQSTIMHPAAFIKGSLLKSCKGYNEDFKIASDYDFFIKALYKLNVTYYKIKEFISVFDTEGLSSSIAQKEIVKNERVKIWSNYFHPDIIELIEDYIKINNKYTNLSKLNSVKILKKIKKISSPNLEL